MEAAIKSADGAALARALEKVYQQQSGNEEDTKATTGLKRKRDELCTDKPSTPKEIALALDKGAWRDGFAGLLAFFLAERDDNKPNRAEKKTDRGLSIALQKLCIYMRAECGSQSEGDSARFASSTSFRSDKTRESLIEFFRTEFQRIPHSSEDMELYEHLNLLLTKELLKLYRTLKKQDLSAFLLKNVCHPYRKRAALSKDPMLQRFPGPNLSQLDPRLALPFSVLWGEVLLSQGQVVEAEQRFSYALGYYWGKVFKEESDVTHGVTKKDRVDSLSRLVKILHFILPIRMGYGRIAEPRKLFGQLRDRLNEIKTIASTDADIDTSTQILGDLDGSLSELESMYSEIGVAIRTGDVQAFESAYSANVGRYERRNVSQIMWNAKMVCYWVLCKRVFSLVRHDKDILAEDDNVPAEEQEDGSSVKICRFTVANKKAIKLDVVFHIFQTLEPKLQETDVLFILAQLIHVRAIKAYVSWNHMGMVFGSQPFVKVQDWIQNLAASN